MKMVLRFALSLGIALAFFCSLAVLILFILNSNKKSETSENASKASVTNGTSRYVGFTAVLLSDPISACRITLDLDSGLATAEDIDLKATLGGDSTTSSVDGLYPMLGRLTENAPDFERYIAVGEEIFAKITDRVGGIVYNKNGTDILLTGMQAANLSKNGEFAVLCRSLAEAAMNYGLYDCFKFVANNSVNNLSYPNAYGIFRRGDTE